MREEREGRKEEGKRRGRDGERQQVREGGRNDSGVMIQESWRRRGKRGERRNERGGKRRVMKVDGWSLFLSLFHSSL